MATTSSIVGTVPLIPDPGNRTLEFPDGVPVADTENMTNGNSAPLFVLGEGNNDRFEVNHNRAALFLHGGAGNDRFLLKTFLVLRENPEDNEEVTNLATLFGGTGNNRYDYLQNAPVFINGGPGIDTIVVIGTPIGDTFIVTDTLIVGAGRITTFLNIEAIEVDGAGGPDTIWIMSTSPNLSTTVIGGGGDDTIHIGGAPPPLDPRPAVVHLHAAADRRRAAAGDRVRRDRRASTARSRLSHAGQHLRHHHRRSSASAPTSSRGPSCVRSTSSPTPPMGWLDAARAQVPYFRFPSITIAGVELLRPNGTLKTAGRPRAGADHGARCDHGPGSRPPFTFLGIPLGSVIDAEVTEPGRSPTRSAARSPCRS